MKIEERQEALGLSQERESERGIGAKGDEHSGERKGRKKGKRGERDKVVETNGTDGKRKRKKKSPLVGET